MVIMFYLCYRTPSKGSNGQVLKSADRNYYLYEVGGNIGQRRLPGNTNMLALYNVNPNAEWVIKHLDRPT